ncbi:hypothetical protein U1Q18_049390 [Sarracenia purpurea var. burkii]
MAMVGGIYGTRGDGFFVISDYGAPMMGESRFALELIANLIQTEALPNDEEDDCEASFLLPSDEAFGHKVEDEVAASFVLEFWSF